MTEPIQRILLVDDDRELCEMLADYFVPEGFETVAVFDGETGLQRAREGGFDLVVLDVMLPGLNGFEVLKRMRETLHTPVLMLTARGDDVDRIVGLEIGADDYLSKPFNPRELAARIRAILRRATAPQPGSEVDETVTVGGLRLDPGTHRAFLDDHDLELTGAEFRILGVLMRRAGRVVSRDELTREALGREHTPFDRSVDTHVSNLRKKIGPVGDGGTPIRNVRGAGYLLERPAESPEQDAT